VPQIPVHVIDDGSSDPRVMPLLARYKEAGLIESVEQVPHGSPYPPGVIRRRMIDRFLADSPARADDLLVQVESDILIGPGQVRALVDAYAGFKAIVGDLHFLNAFWHSWVRPCLRVLACGPYRVGITQGGSEPFWTSDRASLARAVAEGLLPAERPDLVPWLNRYNGATLFQPEISCQHIGAGKASLLYNYFPAEHVLFRQNNETMRDSGPLRQPYPEHPLTWPAFEAEMPGSALRLYEHLRSKSVVPLPEFPHGH